MFNNHIYQVTIILDYTNYKTFPSPQRVPVDSRDLESKGGKSQKGGIEGESQILNSHSAQISFKIIKMFYTLIGFWLLE